MKEDAYKYRISWWLQEFINPETERAFQHHIQEITARQLRTALLVWGVLLLLFAVPDYIALGLGRPFLYLLAYRAVIALSVFILAFRLRARPDLSTLGYPVTLLVVAGLSGFMLLFVYRPEITTWTIGVILIMLIAMFIFLPNRFIMTFFSALYGILITLVTRGLMGSSQANLIGLFFILLLPVAVGTVAAIRLHTLQRQQFALLSRSEEINLELAKEIERRSRLEATLEQLAATDPLTGLYNRREYEKRYQHEMARAKRLGNPLSLCIIDLDHFKRVNDTYGHTAGDTVLRQLAELCRKNVRVIDIIGRLGGEEFVVLMPDTRVDQAAAIAGRLLQELAATDIDTGIALVRVTATIGVTHLLGSDMDMDDMIRRADAALYQGKEAGRNQVVVAGG